VRWCSRWRILARNGVKQCVNGKHPGLDASNDDLHKPFYKSRRANDPLETCNGHLIACEKETYHEPYHVAFLQHNLVTMLREPFERFTSEIRWQFTRNSSHTTADALLRNKQALATRVKTISRMNNTQSLFVSGRESNPTAALAIASLHANFVFFGITDHWGLSLCVFHCELGGEFVRDECVNTRVGIDRHAPRAPRCVRTVC
jgi:hypothetical protein